MHADFERGRRRGHPDGGAVRCSDNLPARRRAAVHEGAGRSARGWCATGRPSSIARPLVLTPVCTDAAYVAGFRRRERDAHRGRCGAIATLMAMPVLGLPAAVVPTGVADGLADRRADRWHRAFAKTWCLDAAAAIEARAGGKHRSTPMVNMRLDACDAQRVAASATPPLRATAAIAMAPTLSAIVRVRRLAASDSFALRRIRCPFRRWLKTVAARGGRRVSPRCRGCRTPAPRARCASSCIRT